MDRAASTASEISMPFAKASSAITVAAAAKADVADQVVQAATAGSNYTTWAAINAIPWGTIASIVAAVYTTLLITEWFWKKLWRPLAERQGWLQPKKPRIMTVQEYDAYIRSQGDRTDDTDRAPL